VSCRRELPTLVAKRDACGVSERLARHLSKRLPVARRGRRRSAPRVRAGPTDKRASATGITLYQWRGGKVVEAWTQWDNLGLARQLGAAPPEGSMGERLGSAIQRLAARRMRKKHAG